MDINTYFQNIADIWDGIVENIVTGATTSANVASFPVPIGGTIVRKKGKLGTFAEIEAGPMFTRDANAGIGVPVRKKSKKKKKKKSKKKSVSEVRLPMGASGSVDFPNSSEQSAMDRIMDELDSVKSMSAKEIKALLHDVQDSTRKSAILFLRDEDKIKIADKKVHIKENVTDGSEGIGADNLSVFDTQVTLLPEKKKKKKKDKKKKGKKDMKDRSSGIYAHIDAIKSMLVEEEESDQDKSLRGLLRKLKGIIPKSELLKQPVQNLLGKVKVSLSKKGAELARALQGLKSIAGINRQALDKVILAVESNPVDLHKAISEALEE